MEDVNKQLVEIWKGTHTRYRNGLMPFFLERPESNSVTFIGLNPSFSEMGFEKGLLGTDYEKIDIRTFYEFPESQIFSMEKALSIERIMREKYPYFKYFKKLMEGTGELYWNHLDLFYLRETSQGELRKLILKRTELNDFGREQLKITKSILDQITPKVIVVANALGSKIFKKEFEPQFSETHGCYFTEIQGREIPTFLSSMFSGGALDIFSRERLGWQIRKVLKEIC